VFVEFVPSGVGEAVFERVDFVLVVGGFEDECVVF